MIKAYSNDSASDFKNNDFIVDIYELNSKGDYIAEEYESYTTQAAAEERVKQINRIKAIGWQFVPRRV